MKTVVSCAIVACALAQPGQAQSRPDFSGRWTTDAPAAAPAAGGDAQRGAGGRGGARGGGARGGGGRGQPRGDMGSGWGSNITVTQDAATLAIEYVFFGRGDIQPPLRFVYPLDGRERTNTLMMGWGLQEQRSRSAWRSDTLVITTMHTFPNPETGQQTPMEVRHALSLIADSLIVDVTRAGVLGGPETATRTVYRKY